MTKTTLIFAVLSVLIPATGYVFVFVLGASPARHPEPLFLIPAICNAIGLAFSLISLERSNERPTNVSNTMRLALFFGTVGLLGNTIAAQWLFALFLHFQEVR